jgi:ATP adenylyltransferase
LGSTLIEGELRQAAPYNLLLTRDWMLLVPRSQECAGPVSINALGFAGSLFVKDETQMGFVREHGPMRMLRETARSLTG